MERKEEIKVILKSLLGKVDKAIDQNQYSDNLDNILESCESVVEIALSIEKYLIELKHN